MRKQIQPLTISGYKWSAFSKIAHLQLDPQVSRHPTRKDLDMNWNFHCFKIQQHQDIKMLCPGHWSSSVTLVICMYPCTRSFGASQASEQNGERSRSLCWKRMADFNYIIGIPKVVFFTWREFLFHADFAICLKKNTQLCSTKANHSRKFNVDVFCSFSPAGPGGIDWGIVAHVLGEVHWIWMYLSGSPKTWAGFFRGLNFTGGGCFVFLFRAAGCLISSNWLINGWCFCWWFGIY